MAALIRRVLVGVAVLAAVWTIWLVIRGGIDVNIFGSQFTSNEPLRPFLIANVALALYVAFGPGVARLWTWLRAIASRVDARLVASLLAATVAACGITYATTVAGGADSYGYVSQADLWLARDLTIEQPWMAELPWPNQKWTATPLGYRPIEREGEWSIVPTYSAGLPLLMAVAKGIFGHAALFWVVPLSGAVLVLATFGIGTRLGSSGVGLAAAWLVATSPIVLFMLMPPMTDVPVAAAWAASLYFALGGSPRSLIAAGLAASIAILIRPNLVMLAAPVAFAGAGFRPLHLLLFSLATAPGIAAVAAINNALYGSPLTSGYGGLGDAFAWSNVVPNAQRYLAWFVESQTPIALLGVAAVLVPVRQFWPWVTHRRGLYALTAIVVLMVAQYFSYLVFDTWWFLRFFIPVWPAIGLGVAGVLLLATRARQPLLAVLSVWLVVVLGLYTLRSASKLGAFGGWMGERAFPDVAAAVRSQVGERAVVLTLIHSGALRYYGGVMTLRFDSFDRDSLDGAVEWLRSRGVTTYALLEPWEVPQFKEHFAGQRALTAFDDSAVLVYRGINIIRLYDLSSPTLPAPRSITARDPATLRSVEPAPAPVFPLSPR